MFAVNAPMVAGFLLLAAAAHARPTKFALPFLAAAGGAVIAAVAAFRWRQSRRHKTLALVGVGGVAAVMAGWMVPYVFSSLLIQDEEHSAAPEIALHLTDGSTIDLQAQPGRVVVLNFWGVWCGPCVKELPEFDRVARSERWRGRVIFVAVDSSIGGETLAQVKSFVAKIGLKTAVAFDGDEEAYKKFGVRGLPTTIVIDAHRTIRFRRVGYVATGNYSGWLENVIQRVL